MGCKLLAVFFFASLFTSKYQSFVDTAPLDEKNFEDKLSDEPVKELESLKNVLEEATNGNEGEVVVSKSQSSFFSNVNGRKSAHKETENEVGKNGKLLMKVAQKIDVLNDREGKPKSVSRTEVEIPSKGIHNVVFKNNEKAEVSPSPSKKQERVNINSVGNENGIDKMNSVSGMEYSPLDMAEYIFWTGDEKGVALTIEEFLEEGLMTREEAINFLQSIKFNLDFMQARYQGLRKINEKMSTNARNLKEELLSQEKTKPELFDERHQETKITPYDLTRPKSDSFEILSPVKKAKENSFDDSVSRENVANDDEDYLNKRSKNKIEMNSLKKLFNGMSVSNDDYEEILERLRVADFLYKEYSLEEVIFQLAKVMFSQSLTKGNKEAQRALQRFTSFLQKEVKHGQISKSLEKKIFDVLITALMETLTENPELLSAAKEELENMTDLNTPTSVMLRQLLSTGAENRSSGKLNLKESTPEKTLQSSKEVLPERPLKNVD